jgi:hypothetical protein
MPIAALRFRGPAVGEVNDAVRRGTMKGDLLRQGPGELASLGTRGVDRRILPGRLPDDECLTAVDRNLTGSLQLFWSRCASERTGAMKPGAGLASMSTIPCSFLDYTRHVPDLIHTRCPWTHQPVRTNPGWSLRRTRGIRLVRSPMDGSVVDGAHTSRHLPRCTST